jgi:hypothetical protein
MWKTTSCTSLIAGLIWSLSQIHYIQSKVLKFTVVHATSCVFGGSSPCAMTLFDPCQECGAKLAVPDCLVPALFTPLEQQRDTPVSNNNLRTRETGRTALLKY